MRGFFFFTAKKTAQGIKKKKKKANKVEQKIKIASCYLKKKKGSVERRNRRKNKECEAFGG